MVAHWVPDPLGLADPPVGSLNLADVGGSWCAKERSRGTLGGLGGTWAPLGGLLMLV